MDKVRRENGQRPDARQTSRREVGRDMTPDTELGELIASMLETAVVFAIPMTDRFRGITVREGVLLTGPAGWAEFSPFKDYTDQDCRPWLWSAIDSATRVWPTPRRDRIPVNVTVPVVSPERAFDLVQMSGCRTAKVKVADPGVPLAADADRLAAVRAALGPGGRIRIDANGLWSVAAAVAAVAQLDDAAGGLEYVEQPCRTIPELALVRAAVSVPVAADESIRREADPFAVAAAGAADVAVLKVAPLGGVHRLLEIAARLPMPVVVSSAVDTAVGIAAGLAAAGALPELPFACGLATGQLLRGDVSSAAERPESGTMAVPDAAPDPDLAAEWAADAGTEAYWRARLARVAALLEPVV